MKTSLNIRVPEDEFKDIKTLAGLEETSMSAMLDSAINYVADNPDVLSRVIQQLLEESMVKTHESQTRRETG